MNQMNPYVNPQQYNAMLSRYSQQQQNALNNGINWVQGIEGAKAFQLYPNSNAILMDSENDGRFYIKICDSVGMSTLRIFNYTEVTDTLQTTNNIDLSEYVKKTELQDLISSMLGGNNNEPVISTNDSDTTTSKRRIIQ